MHVKDNIAKERCTHILTTAALTFCFANFTKVRIVLRQRYVTTIWKNYALWKKIQSALTLGPIQCTLKKKIFFSKWGILTQVYFKYYSHPWLSACASSPLEPASNLSSQEIALLTIQNHNFMNKSVLIRIIW